MRAFPRIARPRLRARGRRRSPRASASARPRGPHAALVYGGPALLLVGACVAYAEWRESGAGPLVLLACAAALALAQRAALRRARPRTLLPLSVDEGRDRRFLLDLSGGVRATANVEELYAEVTERVAAEFGVEGAALLIRDDATGDFVCRASCRHAPGGPPGPGGQADGADALALDGGAFVIRRLRHLASPLGVEPHDLALWASGAPPESKGAREREVNALRRLGARLLVQVRARDQLTGVLVLGPRRRGGPFSEDEKLLLASVAGQLALVVENSKLLERMVEEERLRRELALAAEVQQRLFPERPPASASLELAGFCQPARKVGGDYYDFLVFESGQVGLVVADVAGKGMSAALLMSTLQASLRAQVDSRDPDAGQEGALADLASALNRLLCRATGPASYVTFFYAQFDERRYRLSYVNAGHNPPLLLRAEGGAPPSPTSAEEDAPVKLDAGGPVLGIFEGCRYEQGAVPMRGGDILVGYTDGVVEALNAEGVEFGEGRLQEAVAASAARTAAEICERVVKSVGDWSSGAPQHDDLTLVVLKVARAAQAGRGEAPGG